MSDANPRFGAVAIGRNEGDRLRQCLVSLKRDVGALVYVDSGSTDGSASLAESLGAQVVNLDMRTPFTAARARNEGFARLMSQWPALEFVQFVDGDCEVDAAWISTAVQFLDGRTDVVAVSGRRRERYPERSIYNRLCDQGWQWSTADTRSFGGDVMLRTAALRNVGGYNPALIAGEEPELCIRLRRAGWKIWQVDTPMTLHDANILSFGPWWWRNVRTGYAYAEGAAMYGLSPERHWLRQLVSACAWGLFLPLTILLTLATKPAWAPWLLLLYPLQIFRIYRDSALAPRHALLRSVFLVTGKFAEAAGALKYAIARLKGKQSPLIEYK